MSRHLLRLALLPVIVIVLGSCRDAPTAPAGLGAEALLSVSSTLPEAIDATIQQIFTKGARASVDARWRNATAKLSAGQVKVAHQMLAELVDWIEKNTSEITPPAGETQAHAAARLALYMSLYAHRDPSQPMPEIPTMGSDAALKLITPAAAATVVTVDGKAGIAIPKGAVAEPTVLVIYAADDQARARCAGPLDTELCQYPGFYNFEMFPHRRLTTPARVGICGPETMPARARIAHAAPSTADQVTGGILADGIEILPAVAVTDFLPCGTGGLTLSFSEFNPVDPIPQHSRYCPTETERTATYADLDSAIAHVPESNIVVVCDGTWPTNEADVNKPITIRSETQGGATLAQPEDAVAGTAVLRINGVASGEVRVADLNVQFRTMGIRTLGTFDQITLDSVNLAGPGGKTITTGLFLGGSSVATAHVTVTRSRFTLSYYGVRQNEPVAVDTYDSHFENIGWAGLLLWSTPRTNVVSPSVTGQAMQKADVIGNMFVNIPVFGVGAAVSIQAAGDHLIQDNQFYNADVGGAGATGGASAVFATRAGVTVANTRPIRVRDNVIVGHAPSGDPTLQINWGVGAAIRVINGVTGVSDSVSHNSVTGAFIGLDVNAPAEMTASDNTFTGIYIGVRKNGTSAASITRNDFIAYTFPITASASTPPGNPSLTNGSMACNWWGSAAAPAPLGPAVNPGGYLPFATQAIANTEIECNVNTDSPPVVRVCSTASGSVPTVPTLTQAIQLVAAGGTIKICDGTHLISETNLGAKALTIEGEGPGIATLDPGGMEKAFHISSPTPNNRAIVLRKLSLRNAALTGIRVSQQYGTVLIDQVDFHPTPGIVEPGQTLSSGSGIDILNAVGGGITVQNSAFDGGDIGVNVQSTSNVVVSGSTFSNHRNAAVHVRNGGAVTFIGNTVSGCGFAWCVSFWGSAAAPGNHRILNNTIAVDFAKHTSSAIQVHFGTNEIAGNVITGVGGTRGAGGETWPMDYGISSYDQAQVSINDNRITGAWTGMVFDATTGTGIDNAISAVGRVLSLSFNAAVSISRSDFSDYGISITAPTSTASLARCNWWGSLDGPSNPQTDGSAGVFSPWASAPIANTQTSCDPNAPAPAVVRVCATPGNGPEPTLATISAALGLVAAGRTVRVCDGTHATGEIDLSTKLVSTEGDSRLSTQLRAFEL